MLRGFVVIVCRERRLGSARTLAPLRGPTPLSDTCSPALEHVSQIPIGSAPPRHPCGQMLDFAGKTDPAQVVSQIARVKMSPLTVPGKNGITQLLELPVDQLDRRQFFFDHLEQPRMHHHRQHQLAFDEALARGDGCREARRADAGVT